MPQKATFTTPIDAKTIGKRLRDIRKRRGVTQVELAQRLGMRQGLVSSYELGKLRMHGGIIVAFAKALSASADELLGLREPKGGGEVLDRRLLRRLQDIQSLSKTNKQALLKTIDTFLRGVRAA